jgi:hypothetical protein
MLIPKMDDVSEMALGEERKRIRSTGVASDCTNLQLRGEN